MTLDVLVATCERPAMLARALESLVAAPVPPGLTVHVTVIQNDASDVTADVICDFSTRFPGRVSYLRELRRGKSHALNAAIAATDGDLIGVIDDDEEIDRRWFATIAEMFSEDRVDFIGGPCLPRWGAVPPGWLPSSFHGPIGYVDDGDRVMVFGKDAPGILMGGNSVLRRSTLLKVGTFSTLLGPRPERRLLCGEDEDLYTRLLKIAAYGLYVPSLVIYHYVPPQRLTKQYYRQWSFWQGVSRSVIDRLRPVPVARVGRVPRYLYGSALRGLVGLVRTMRTDPAMRFANELSMWQLAGFVYGSYWFRALHASGTRRDDAALRKAR